MKTRLALKLRKEMLSWNKDSPVRHRRSTLRRAWVVELRHVRRATWSISTPVILGIPRLKPVIDLLREFNEYRKWQAEYFIKSLGVPAHIFLGEPR